MEYDILIWQWIGGIAFVLVSDQLFLPWIFWFKTSKSNKCVQKEWLAENLINVAFPELLLPWIIQLHASLNSSVRSEVLVKNVFQDNVECPLILKIRCSEEFYVHCFLFGTEKQQGRKGQTIMDYFKQDFTRASTCLGMKHRIGETLLTGYFHHQTIQRCCSFASTSRCSAYWLSPLYTLSPEAWF